MDATDLLIKLIPVLPLLAVISNGLFGDLPCLVDVDIDLIQSALQRCQCDARDHEHRQQGRQQNLGSDTDAHSLPEVAARYGCSSGSGDHRSDSSLHFSLKDSLILAWDRPFQPTL